MVLFSEAGSRDGMAECLHRFLENAVRLNSGRMDNLEIEAKFGLLVDKTTGSRVQLPVLSECVVNFEGWASFVSDMPMAFHRRFNELLNKRFADRSLGWQYRHTRLADKSFACGVRLTVDSGSGRVLQALRKRKLDHLAIHFPQCPMDVRISVSIEEDLGPDCAPNSQVVSVRHKDRLSYTVEDGLLSVDLTQVVQQANERELRHELEVEVLKTESFIREPDLQSLFLRDLQELLRSVCP